METSLRRNARTRAKARIKIDDVTFPLDYRKATAAFLKQYLTEVLKEYKGNISEAARALSVSRRTLQLQSTRLEIDTVAMRNGSTI